MKIQSLTFGLILIMLYPGLVSCSDYESAAVVLLERIALGEGTSDAAAHKHGLASAYEITYAYGQYNPPDSKPLTEMTIGEVKQLQRQMLANQAGNKLQSSAVGKYQLISTTLKEQQKKLGLSDDTKFDAATQELFGLSLLEKRFYREWTEGKISDNQFQQNLAKEWASVADPNTGKSYYGQSVGTTDTQIKEAMAQTKSLLGISQDSPMESSPARQPSMSEPVTLTLYLHDGSASGPIIPGARISGQDGSGNRFQQTTVNTGNVKITGYRGTWSFTASADGYEAKSWTQPITETDTKDAYLQKTLGGINFTSIRLNYISVNEDNSSNIGFDYIFKAQKTEGSSFGIDLNDSTTIGLNAFMIGLVVPSDKFWVNLDDNEPDRIIDEQLRGSEAGRIMLEADLQMKRDYAKYDCAIQADNASLDRLIYIKKNSLVQQCMDKFPGEIKNITNVHFQHTLTNRIIPDKIYAYADGDEIYIINASLTIENYAEGSGFTLSEQDPALLSDGCREELNRSVEEYGEYDKEIEGKTITPLVIEEINHGEKYENLREVYVALALAQWYKSNIGRADILQNSLISSNFTASKAVKPWSPEEIWGRYRDSIANEAERCTWWFNTTIKTTTGTIKRTILMSRGGVNFGDILDHLVEIEGMPPEIQDKTSRAIASGFVDAENEVLFGNKIHAAVFFPSPTSSSHADHNLAITWNNKGVDLSNQGKLDEAIEAYNEAIRLDPNYAMARTNLACVWNNKGVALKKQGKLDEAIEAYDEAIRLDPNYGNAWNNKGIALSNLGKHNEALQAYDKATKINPQDSAAWGNKGAALKALGRITESEAAFAKSEELENNG